MLNSAPKDVKQNGKNGVIKMVKWDKEYHERTGKWRPLKEYTKRVINGKVKYKWDDPIYLGKQQRALENLHGDCVFCGDFVYSDPCIHHLPDGYQNDMRRRAYYKKIKEERNAAYLAQSQQRDFDQ